MVNNTPQMFYSSSFLGVGVTLFGVGRGEERRGWAGENVLDELMLSF